MDADVWVVVKDFSQGEITKSLCRFVAIISPKDEKIK